MSPLESFRSAKRPDATWLLTFFVLAAAVLFGDWFFFNFKIHTTLFHADLAKVIFVYYAILFFSCWLVYFCSPRLQIQSLRFLLTNNTEQWQKTINAGDKAASDQLLKYYQEKARVTITTQSILIAVSVLTIVQIERRLIDLGSAGDAWETTLLKIAMVTSLGAFVLLIYAVDCMDTMFNKFMDKEGDMIHYFYSISKRPKYYGMLLVLSALIFMLGSAYPAIAAFGMGVSMFVGYQLWYPEFRLPGWRELPRWHQLVGNWVRLAVCVFPLLTLFFL